MSWTNETKIAFTIFLCAALIGAALMLRESGITGLATEDNANLPPKWIGETNKYVIEQNAPLMLNLAELFSDPEGQVLAFVATEAKDLSIVIDGSQLAIVPEQGFVGERIVTVYASDGEKITHKKIKVEVGELQSLSEGIQPDNESASILESEPTSQPEQSPLPDAGITGGGSIAVTCNSCGDCTACAASPGNTCVLTTGISSSTTCITIGNDNVTINCDGKTITFNTGGGGNDYGITSDSRRNLTIANCTIISASASVSAVPINLYRTNSSLIINNTIKALSTNGIDVRSSFYNVITSNKVNATNPNGNAGIKLRQTSAYNNITANTVLTNGSSVGNVAILADFESPNNTIANNFVVTGGSSSSNYGINSETGDTKIINNSINTTGPSVNHGILLNGGTNSIVANNSILATGTSLAQSGIYVINAMQNVFINNIIRTIGSTKNHGIYIDAGADRNVFLQNTISGNGTDTFAIYIESGVSGSNFSSTIINNTPAWIYTNTNTFSNFSNTTFAMPNGSINILPLIQLNSSQNISKERLNISYNKAFLNSTNLTYFNTSAIITLYGLSYSDPAPVVDYEDDGSYEPCSPSQCSELSYSGGVFVFNTTRFTTYSTQDAGAITSCPVTINMSTTLTQDLVSNDTCITIGNDSIVLDCAGYSISYNAKGSDYKYGIVAVNQNNITVKDCFIRDINASGMAGYGINFTGVNNSIVTNSIILTNGTQFSVGIFLQNSNNNTIANSTINATDSSHNWAIGLISSQNTTIIGNNLVSHGTSANNHGISITGFSHGPIISYNNISISGTSNNWGIFMQYANYAIVSNNTISTNCTTSSNNGLLIQYSDWGNFSSNYISAYGSDKENCGIFTYVSNTLSLYNNYISSNGGANNYGIYAYSGENNTFAFNTINTNGTGFSHGILMNYTKRFNIFSNNIRTNDASSYGIFITYSNSTLLNNTVLNDTVHWLFFDKNTFSNLTNTTFQTPLGSINVIQFMQINESEDITKAKLNITYNKAFLNSSNLTYFNTSAIITLYGLSYSDPKPVVDYGDNGSYEDCPSDVCTELSYSGGVFVFNTTRFTSYSAEESGGGTCGTCFECSSCASTPEASCAVTADLGTSGTCITINASNVVLDCQGHTIVFDKWGMGKASGIMSKDAQNVTVKNCNIMTNHSNGNEDFGINFTNSSGFRIINNSIFVNTTSNNRGISIGMYGSGDSCNGIVENNTVVSIGTGSSNVGLFFASACNSNITGNTILANGTFTSYGISLGSSAGLLFSHNNISVIGDISSYAVAISDCLFSVFNATLLNDSSNWIVCGGVSIDNNFTNTTFATMHGSINILPTFNLTGNIYVGRENLNMSNNRAFVNSTALPFLNSSGIITLENITYSNPRPLVDWNDDYSYEPCPVEVCSELDYAGTRYVFNATHFTGYSSDETGTSCPLTIYQSITLANDLSSLTSCITFGNDSIYLDCNGHIIYYNNGSGSDDRGIIAIGRENITVRNCIIKDPTSGGTNNYAIYLEKVSSSVVVNNTMYANCTTSCNGMVLRNSSEGNIVANNTIITLNQVSYNVEVDNSSTNAIVGNTIIANSSGNTQVGIRLRDSHSSNISYNNISIMGNSNNVCIELRNAENNSIENNTIINYGSGDNNHGMLLWDNSSNNSVVMNAIRASSTGNAIMLDHAGANVFIANWLRGGGNGYALWIEGSSFSSFYKTIINESTHFIYVNNTEHNNFTNTTFDNIIARVNFPWILQFNGTQNVSAGKLQLSPNRVFLNSTNLSFMNTTAIITLNEIAFIEPEPAVDYDDDGSYVPCPAEVCTELGYTDNIYVFNVTGFTSYKAMETAQINITSCPVVINSSAILKNDVSSSGSCITINASNAFLDCQGYLITYNSGGGNNNYGIGSFSNNNVTVRNCRINDSSTAGSNGYGIFFNATNSSIVLNSSIQSWGTFSNSPVWMHRSAYNRVENNTLLPRSIGGEVGLNLTSSLWINATGNTIITYTAGDTNLGVHVSASGWCRIANNSITTYGNFGDSGVQLLQTNYSTIANNIISTSGTASEGVYAQNAHNNSLSGNVVNAEGDGVSLYGSQQNLLDSNNITTSSSYSGINLAYSNLTNATNTQMNTTGHWINATESISNRFVNTTFGAAGGKINLPYNFTISGTYDINRARLLPTSTTAKINTVALPFLNTTGIISLYGIAASIPLLVVDYEDDGSYAQCGNVCTELAKSGSTYVFNVTHFTTFSAMETNITSCPVTINTSTILAGDLSSNTTCITIGASNVKLDCNGSTITFGINGAPYAAGVLVNQKNNVTISNCTIILGNASANYSTGINSTNTGNATMEYNTIRVNGTRYGIGISIEGDYDCANIRYNTIQAYGSSDNNKGIRIVLPDFNNVTGNIVSVNGTESNVALYIYSSHNDSVWSNSLNASGTGSDNNAMSLINTVMYGRIENNSISAFGDGGGNYGIYMVGIAQNNITGNAIRTSSPGTGNHGILIGVSANSNRFLLNNITTTGTTGFGIMAWDFSTNNIFNKTLLNTTAWIFIEDDATATFANTTFVRPAGSIVLNNFTLSGGYFSITESKLNISSNKAYLNSTNLTRLNTSGIVTLYGIGYADPTPIVDYEDDGSYANCPSSVCAELGYSGGAYTYNVSHFTSFSSSENITRITGCPATINESTELSQNISSNTSCITIGASNLELDCNGSTITYALQGGAGVNRGVFASYRRNVTIRDCTIILGNSSASNSYGIVLYRVNDSIVRNNTLLNNGTRNDDAILLDTYAFNNTIIENRITAGSNESDGINIKQLSENNTIQGNTINTLGTEENDGIYVYLSHGSRIYDNNITTNCTEINNHGIFIDYYSNYTAAGRNTIQRLGTGGGDYGIYLFAGSSNSNFSANTLVSHNALISDEAIVVQSGSNNNRFSFTNISSDVHSSYGAYIQQSAGLYFNNTLMNSTPYWIYLDSSSSANFTNTTFLTGSGSISLFAFNITAGAYVIANELSLNISSNRAYLNSTNLTRLNTSGIVTLYGIGYADPTPIVDYEDDGSYANCPSSVCAELGYSGGAYTYNVSHFTSYACVEGGMLGISKSDSPDPVSAESLLNYTIAVNVTGSIYNLTLTDQYPAQAIYQGSSPSPVAGTNNTWVLGNLTPGTNTSINISVRIRWVLNNTMINNTANVSFQNSTGTWNASVTEQTTVLNGRVIRSLIINSTIINCTIIDSTVINSTKQDCVIINSTVIDSLNINVTIIDSNETNSTDSNSFMKRSFAINLTKANSNLTDSNLTNSNVTNVTLDGCTVDNSTIFNVVNSSCTYYNYRQQQPPQPTPTQGGGGGNIGIPRWPAPEKAVGHLCVENWACEDWTRCIEGTQQRVCVELNGCNETRYEPVTERTCAMERVLREAPEKAEVPKVPVLPSERPEREAPAVVEKGLPAILLPLALDIALIMLAVLVIISLIVGSEKRSKKGLRAVIVLLMVAGIGALVWHYTSTSQLLIMQAIALAVLSAAIMLVWIYDWRKSKKPGEIPEEEPVAPVIEEEEIQTPAVYVEPKPAKPMPEIPEPLPESPKPEWKPVPEARRKVIFVEEEEPKPRKPVFLEPVRETVPEKKVVLVRKQKRAEPERVARLVRAEPLDLDAVLMRTGKTLKKVHKTLRRMKKKK